MIQTLVVHLDKPLTAVSIADSHAESMYAGANTSDAARHQPPANRIDSASIELEKQKLLYQDACQTLQNAAARLNQLADEMFAGHNEAIARLSVEIARKVLMRNIRDGDYEIEAIIKESLQNAPENSNVVVRLNPQDVENFQTLQDSRQTSLCGFEIQADANIDRAECVVESTKGMVKFLIDEQLERISKALAETG